MRPASDWQLSAEKEHEEKKKEPPEKPPGITHLHDFRSSGGTSTNAMLPGVPCQISRNTNSSSSSLGLVSGLSILAAQYQNNAKF